MTVLVTGGAGYIGSHMVWDLLEAGESVVVVDTLSTGFKWAVPPEAKLVIGDIGDQSLMRQTIERNYVDAIIHFAGSVVVPDSVRDPLAYYENNTAKSRTLIDAAVKSDVKNFIFSSTAAVYGDGGLLPVNEDHPTRPESPYGLSKLMTEWMLRDTAAAHNFHYTALRYFNVAGADPNGRTGQSTRGATHLIKIACETALGKRRYMEVFGNNYPTPDGTCVRDYIHVTDLVAAHRLALERLRSGGSSMVANCGYGRGYSVKEVIASVERVHGAPIDARPTSPRPGDAASVVADSNKARNELGWVPQLDDLDKIVESALKWEASLQFRNQR
ncbi:UDP-glucose 4-epimerase GalE [Phyllobacterium sp. 21LDTY02-6]|uniref:UDP-glucose 4-epimerase GalE n=1 Tax=unclassified Phyllobacterium TaxID=2638441 RepID=UPI002021C272|nr:MULTISPECIES: UDP-glucose 4-epimerase GalE [unclassified Phyllobacterium]MCO4318775.1 UDP-glucose 4-epimerase GalE [Phyllobacterium sp. 21LDTY02-6]MCX8281958.1 UDP-glucose 4-epimerase GalE [Phyllobacterium sp. 0TCS1.6C]MCX8294421.1 UDP-glucose 4-epimerase GalE [Phyllobacterium sp. 0TCS1.6A]